MGVSKNSGGPKSSILIGFSIINHPFWGYPYFWKHPNAHKISGHVPFFHVVSFKSSLGKIHKTNTYTNHPICHPNTGKVTQQRQHHQSYHDCTRRVLSGNLWMSVFFGEVVETMLMLMINTWYSIYIYGDHIYIYYFKSVIHISQYDINYCLCTIYKHKMIQHHMIMTQYNLIWCDLRSYML